MPSTVDELLNRSAVDTESPWVVLVWNDPVNLISYVCITLQKIFGYSQTKAMKLTMEVHNDGKSVVSSGAKEACEMNVFRLHEHGLWATMQKDS